jgi:hypothetical protein
MVVVHGLGLVLKKAMAKSVRPSGDYRFTQMYQCLVNFFALNFFLLLIDSRC